MRIAFVDIISYESNEEFLMMLEYIDYSPLDLLIYCRNNNVLKRTLDNFQKNFVIVENV